MRTQTLQIPKHLNLSGSHFWRWGKRIALVLLIGVIALAAFGATYQAVATQIDRQTYPAPGHLVDVGGYRLHLNVMGEATDLPTIILNAGAGSFSAQWGLIQPELAKVTRVVSFDRAGLGWSDPLPNGLPVDAATASAALHTALQQAGIAGPYLLVGHSLGGGQVQVFADMYPTEVAGLVVLDAIHPDGWRYLTPEATAEQQAFVQRAKLLPLLARFGLMRLMNPFAGNTGDLPARQAAEIQAKGTTVAHLTAWQAEFEQLAPTTATINQLRQAAHLEDVPLLVITHGAGDDSFTHTQWLVDAELAGRSRQGQQHLIAGADHVSLVTNHTHAGQVVELIRTLLEK